MSDALAVTADSDPVDPVVRLVLAWLSSQRSRNTAAAYGRDLGVRITRGGGAARRDRAPRVMPWLDWCRAAGVEPLAATEDAVNVYARALDAAGLSAATRARKLSAIAGWYTWLARRGCITASPADVVKRPDVAADTSTTPGLTRGQAVALMAAADSSRGPQLARSSALMAVLLLTGARVSEVTGADDEDLGTDRGHRVLWVTRKGGKRQALALPAPAAQRVDAYLAARADLAGVPALPGQPGTGRPRRVLFATETGARMFSGDVWRLVRRLGKAAGLPADLVGHLGPHAMRHSFATLYLDSGGSLRDLQDAMGHADPRTTRRYDRARFSLDRSPGYALAGYLAAAETGS